MKYCIKCKQEKEYFIDDGWLSEVYAENEYWTCPECAKELVKPRCIIGKITNLVTLKDDKLGKEFQIFNAAGYKLVTGKHYVNNQLGIVIPPGFILPDNILDDMWLRGRLAGKKRNRVVAKLMFGIFSEAIFYGNEFTHDGKLIKSPAWHDNWREGDDVTEEIGAVYKCVSTSMNQSAP
jgi:hypothetical protein